VGLSSKANSFADSIDKMFDVSSPKSHTSLDVYVSKCIHAILVLNFQFIKDKLNQLEHLGRARLE